MMTREPREMLVPTQDFIHSFNGIEYSYSERNTRVWSDEPRIQGIRELFRPIDPSDRPVEAASAAPGERR